eukprot:11927553-Alexandrium_andersonii.AAC.1
MAAPAEPPHDLALARSLQAEEEAAAGAAASQLVVSGQSMEDDENFARRLQAEEDAAAGAPDHPKSPLQETPSLAQIRAMQSSMEKPMQ